MMAKSTGKGSGKAIPQVEIDLNISAADSELLLRVLRERFENSMSRHAKLEWTPIQVKLEARAGNLASLQAMESTGGEPDVIGYEEEQDKYIFCDCSAESPNRRSICYDRAGEEEREKKGVFPGGNAIDLAHVMGIELLDEYQYRELQALGSFDLKTSSWIQAPDAIRKLGGALFGDRRYDNVFVYHNGAQSFYSTRGFRGRLLV
jgi:hypothetical protein